MVRKYEIICYSGSSGVERNFFLWKMIEETTKENSPKKKVVVTKHTKSNAKTVKATLEEVHRKKSPPNTVGLSSQLDFEKDSRYMLNCPEEKKQPFVPRQHMCLYLYWEKGINTIERRFDILQ